MTAVLKKPRSRRNIDDAADAIARSHVIAIPIEKLHRHDANRRITRESVDDLVDSLRDFGQAEPIRVRPNNERGIGHYEILSGERRFVAAGILKWDTLRCLVEEHSDEGSLIELAVANAARKDLNPIERAELLTKLIASGISRDKAGASLGLGSESGIKNSLRLLELPECFKEYVRNGVLNVQQARLLVPFGAATLVRFHDWLTSKSCREYFRDCFFEDVEGTEDILDRWIREETRPVDSKKAFHHGWQLGGEHKCLFKLDALDEAQRKKLDVISIPDDSKQGETRLVALNAKAWHALQDPLVKAKIEAKHKPKVTKRDSTATPTAEDLKAKRKKQDEQLASYSREWVRTGLRCVLSKRLEWKGGCAEYLLPWLLASIHDPRQTTLNDWALTQCSVKTPEPRRFSSSHIKADVFCKHMDAIALEFGSELWRLALWPVAKAESVCEPHRDLAPAGTLPERLPTLFGNYVDELAAAVGVSVETLWLAGRVPDSPEHKLLQQWLTRHTTDQLTALAKELKVPIPKAKLKRSELVAKVLESHVAKPLAVPKLLVKASKGRGV